MSKTKFYVVWLGRKPGIYTSWEDCKKQIFKFEGACYKSFETKQEAEKAYLSNYRKYIYNTDKKIVKRQSDNIITTYIKESLSADAACSGNPGPMEYRIVETDTGKELYRSPVYPEGTVNIGEFLAIVHTLALLKGKKSKIPIYSDSKTALTWVKNKKSNTKLLKTEINAPIFELLERAVIWLHCNDYENPLLKWNTSEWGEIPADFGRK